MNTLYLLKDHRIEKKFTKILIYSFYSDTYVRRSHLFNNFHNRGEKKRKYL